jgi:glycosyltransferase involved in cell wall biosynthesis
MFFDFKNKVDKKWYISNYDDVRFSKLDPKYHFHRYGSAEERLPNPFYSIKSRFFRNFFIFLSILNIRLYENSNLDKSKFINLINLFFEKEYSFLRNINSGSTKIYLTSWVGGGVSDALKYYIKKDLEKFNTIVVLRSLKNISNRSTPIFQIEVYSKGGEKPSISICPFPSIFMTTLISKFKNLAEIDIHHVFGFEKFIEFILNNFETKLNLYVHDYYLFSENWSFFNVDILSTGLKSNYFQTQINNLWPITSRKQLLNKCNSIISTSYHTFKLLNNESDFPVNKLEFKYIPEESNLEFTQFNSITEISSVSKKIKIIVLGNLGIYKGLTQLNNIAEKLNSENFEFKIFHFGDVSEGKLNDAIFSYGWLNKDEREVEIMRLGADLALLPAQSPETYSLILSELIRLKIPIVASRIGALTERIFDRKNAHLVRDYMTTECWVEEIIEFCLKNFENDYINSDFSVEEIELIFDKRRRD